MQDKTALKSTSDSATTTYTKEEQAQADAIMSGNILNAMVQKYANVYGADALPAATLQEHMQAMSKSLDVSLEDSMVRQRAHLRVEAPYYCVNLDLF